jgi:hypothetical protein
MLWPFLGVLFPQLSIWMSRKRDRMANRCIHCQSQFVYFEDLLVPKRSKNQQNQCCDQYTSSADLGFSVRNWFQVSQRVFESVKTCEIRQECYGASDHVPIVIEIALSPWSDFPSRPRHSKSVILNGCYLLSKPVLSSSKCKRLASSNIFRWRVWSYRFVSSMPNLPNPSVILHGDCQLRLLCPQIGAPLQKQAAIAPRSCPPPLVTKPTREILQTDNESLVNSYVHPTPHQRGISHRVAHVSKTSTK